MADEILQSMGFDASDALRTLDLLDKNFATFQNRLNSVAQSMRGFNANAGKTTAALIQIRNNATSTVDALSRLSAQPITLGGRVDGQDLLRGADAAAKMNELLGQTTNQAGQAANAINNVGSQSTKSLNSARRSVNSFAISWETLTRIVTTQILVRSFSQLSNQVRASFQDNLEFTQSLAEIQTLARDQSIASLGGQVRELSDSFNFELLDAANAKFEIMQNGFEQTAEQAEVFSASAAFAKTAVADLATSVDVITGTLNAMGEGADQAEIVAAKLFRTVDQGKVVGTELARVLGRITPAAQELGITLDEELAALSTITIAGVGASEAITQIRGTMIALQKPSEALSAAIRELGFETSEQLIAARGYVGALRAVIGTTDGTQTAIARLFPRVRGLNAAIRLTGEGFDVFNEHLERTQNTSLAEFGDIFETRIDTQSERVQKSLQQLSNFFTVELGGSLVGATDKALQFVGGVDSVIDGMRALVPVVTTGAVVVGSFGVAMGTVTTASRLAAFNLQKQVPTVLNLTNALFGVQNGAKAAAIGLSALQGAATGLFIGVATVEFLKFTRERIDSELDAAVEAYTKGRLEIVKRNASTRAEITAQEEKASSDVIRLLEDQIASKRRIYNQDVDNARDANQLLLTDYRSVLDRITGVFEDHAQTQERRAKQLADAVSNSQQRQVDAVTELADRRFEFQTSRLDDGQRFIALENRAVQLAKQAARALSQAETPDAAGIALDTFRRAQAAADQALSIANQADNANLRLAAERRIEFVLQQQIKAEQQLQLLADRQRQQAEASAAATQERVKNLNAAAKQFLAASKLFDESGDPLSVEELRQNRRAANEALQDFFDLTIAGGQQIQASDLIAFDDFNSKLTSSVTQAEIRQLTVAPQTLDNLRSQIEGSVADIEVLLNLSIDQTAVRQAVEEQGLNEGLRVLSGQLQVAQAEYAQLLRQQDQVATINETIFELAGKNGRVLAATISSATDDIIGSGNAIERFRVIAETGLFGGTGERVPEQLRNFAQGVVSLSDRIVQAGTDASFASEEFNALVSDANAIFRDRPAGSALLSTILPFGDMADVESGIQNALDLLQQIAESRSQLESQFPERGSFEQRSIELRQRIESIRQGLIDAQSASQQTSTNAASVQGSLSQTVDPTQTIRQNLLDSADALERMQRAAVALTLPGSSQVQRAATGGVMRYFDSGGFVPRGTDTIPAMLSPNEQVINATSSRKFFSQLQAINAGIQPVYRNEGGSVTNVGDVNITVNESSSPQATGREVMKIINRQLRRGSSSLR